MASAMTEAQPRARGQAALAWLARAQGPLIGLVVLGLAFSVASPVFLSLRNFLNVVDQVTVLGILAIGMTAVIVIGGIDLSVGSILALATMTMGWTYHDYGVPFGLCIALGLLAGVAAGLVNGLLVTQARLPAFIATLTMMSVARGLASITTNGEQVVGFPDWFTALATVRHFHLLSATVGLFLILAAIAFAFLRFRATGRELYAIGGSAEVARLAGIKVKNLTVAVYAASGLLSAIAGVVMSARLDSAQPSDGLGYELDTIAAVVIGGARVTGGRGLYLGTFAGALFLSALETIITVLSLSQGLRNIIEGAIIVIALLLQSERWGALRR